MTAPTDDTQVPDTSREAVVSAIHRTGLLSWHGASIVADALADLADARAALNPTGDLTNGL